MLHKAQCPTGRSGQRSFLCVTAGRGHHSEPWPCSGEVRVALGAEEEDGPDFRLLVLPLSATSKPDGSFHLQLPQLPHRPSCHAGSRFHRSLPRPRRQDSCAAPAASPAVLEQTEVCSDLISSHRDDDGDVVLSHSRVSGIRVLLPIQVPFPAADAGFSHILPIAGRAIRSHCPCCCL